MKKAIGNCFSIREWRPSDGDRVRQQNVELRLSENPTGSTSATAYKSRKCQRKYSALFMAGDLS
jgi:hypothetical protein